jgi:hypothetical protein
MISCSLEAMESVKAQHSVGLLDLEATESVEAQHSIDALDSVAMKSVEAQDSISGVVLDSVMAMESIDALVSTNELDSDVVPDSVEALDAVTLDSIVLDTVDPLHTIEEVPDSVEEVPDSVEEVSDVDEVVDCPRCDMFHAGGIFGEACYQACRNARRCARCGLLHEDYDNTARFLHDMDKFDCEFFIPDVEKLEMRGETFILPEQVVKKLEEKMEKKLEKMKQAKNSPQANKEDEANNEQ